jgi:hypothetical protein
MTCIVNGLEAVPLFVTADEARQDIFFSPAKEQMHGRLIGREFLKDLLGTSAFPLERPARVSKVTKVTVMADALAVPASVAPTSDAPL